MLSIMGKRRVKIKNWSESIVVEPQYYYEPTNLSELVEIVKSCERENLKMRVIGAGHSFTPLIATGDVLISLDNLSGLDYIDADNHLVTVWAGTRLKNLSPLLHMHGYAMENLGDINEQSIAGAISTGTHGTGGELGSISTQVRAITLLTASGELMEISEAENSELLAATKLSLGMLGIIVKVQLQVVKAYQLIGKSYRLSFDDSLRNLDNLKNNNRNFEMFWFPYTNTVQIKTFNEIDANDTKKKQQFFKKILIENGLFWGMSEVSRLIPRSSKAISTLSALGVPVGEEVNESYLQFATPRLVKFHEMEYALPAESMANVLKDINKLLLKKRYNVHFPFECRYVKGDNLWLSPSFERDSAYIAVHMYKGMDYKAYFKAIEEIFWAYGGRPHWGKMHGMTYEGLQKSYPKLADFLKIRQQLDEKQIFINGYLKDLFQL